MRIKNLIKNVQLVPTSKARLKDIVLKCFNLNIRTRIAHHIRKHIVVFY